MAPSLGSFLCMIALSVEIFFLISNLNVLWYGFKRFPHALSPEEISALPLLLPSWGRCSQQWGHPLHLFSELDKPHILSCSSKVFPLVLSPSFFPSFGHIVVFLYAFYTVGPKTGNSTWGEASQYKSDNNQTIQVLIVNWLTLKAPNHKIYF